MNQCRAGLLHKQHQQMYYMTMTMMRPGLFSQREGPGSEPGNSLLSPDEAPRSLSVRVVDLNKAEQAEQQRDRVE